MISSVISIISLIAFFLFAFAENVNISDFSADLFALFGLISFITFLINVILLRKNKRPFKKIHIMEKLSIVAFPLILISIVAAIIFMMVVPPPADLFFTPTPPIASNLSNITVSPSFSATGLAQKNQQIYTVQKGNTLWGIAQQFYQNGFAWTTIAHDNAIQNPSRLNIGRELLLTNKNTFLDTKNWVTLTNTRYHYQIKYPKTYAPRRCNESDICLGKLKYVDTALGQALSTWVEFNITLNPQNKFGPLTCKTEEECIQKWKQSFDEKEFTDFEKIVDGKKVKGFSVIHHFTEYTGKTSILFLFRDSQIWFISVSDGNIDPSIRDETDKEIDTILSTFAFTQS